MGCARCAPHERSYEAIGSITVNVVGAPNLVPAGIDADKDGFFAGQDCNDGNAAIRPDAMEPAKARKGSRSVLASLTKQQRRLRAGQTIEVWVSAPNRRRFLGQCWYLRGGQWSRLWSALSWGSCSSPPQGSRV